MVDYKELFYKSQAKIADLIDELDKASAELKKFMRECEEAVISGDRNEEREARIKKTDFK